MYLGKSVCDYVNFESNWLDKRDGVCWVYKRDKDNPETFDTSDWVEMGFSQYCDARDRGELVGTWAIYLDGVDD